MECMRFASVIETRGNEGARLHPRRQKNSHVPHGFYTVHCAVRAGYKVQSTRAPAHPPGRSKPTFRFRRPGYAC